MSIKPSTIFEEKSAPGGKGGVRNFWGGGPNLISPQLKTKVVAALGVKINKACIKINTVCSTKNLIL